MSAKISSKISSKIIAFRGVIAAHVDAVDRPVVRRTLPAPEALVAVWRRNAATGRLERRWMSAADVDGRLRRAAGLRPAA